MSSAEPNTTTVNVLVTQSRTVAEPDWCAGHSSGRAEFLPDITHYGPEHDLDFRDHTLWKAMYTQAPFSGAPQVGVYVEQAGYTGTLDAAGLDDLADAMHRHALYLRRLATRLSALEVSEA
ncbi:DUF6907 domain-containing protein [Streptomyces scabiei]|uniref:DUF6907 domain-containing protein n=1 Tax=Streptomyces scabiei TaxID=1930 RepID=UPI0029BC38EF|nr:hypothetical protein [Streptomyces scabiei]MDX2538605.1 hypothetical protein [Streptomyces scabiei]MDX2799879.1 hypothetical protein [Streptomyces scabiei]MDX2858162.1 hypothetical protein [Streptomyces scabiei]MDX3277857.1 hypothetical protein [Streptomyces scabiei]MDX3828534.1 hypothetical protein [Streptomyces scabiei]